VIAGGSASPAVPDLPLYRGILDRLMAEIAAGTPPVGARLPTEQELCTRFSASRHTVRAALRNLQEMGLIRRRQGSGSVVAAAEPRPRYVSSIGALEDLMQYAQSTRLDLLSVDRLTAGAALAGRLGCAAGGDWLCIRALRRSEGAQLPLAYTEIYLPIRFEAAARQVGQVRLAVFRLLERHHGVRVTAVRQTMEAVRADRAISVHLGIDVGDPVLQIDRRYEAGADGLVEVALNSHPPGRFRYELTLRQPPLRALPPALG